MKLRQIIFLRKTSLIFMFLCVALAIIAGVLFALHPDDTRSLFMVGLNLFLAGLNLMSYKKLKFVESFRKPIN